MRVSLEAVIGFVNRAGRTTPTRRRARPACAARLEMSANDRRFLKSLRISADEQAEKEVE